MGRVLTTTGVGASNHRLAAPENLKASTAGSEAHITDLSPQLFGHLEQPFAGVALGAEDVRTFQVGCVLALERAEVGVHIEDDQALATRSREHTDSAEGVRVFGEVVERGFRCQVLSVRPAQRALAAGWFAVG